MPEYDDPTLETIMREGLDFHAAEAAGELSGTLPVVPRRRPPGGRWLAVAAVLVLLAGAGVTVRSALHGSGGSGPVTSDPGEPTSGWRTESYAGVQLRVPPSWGLGAGPVDATGEGPAVCADDTGSPYVGRPALLSDMCVRWRPESGPYPKTDAVWFGSPLDVGSTDAAGRQAVTRAAGGQHVTVFTDDSGVRDAILGSLRAVTVDDNGCSAQRSDHPPAGVLDLPAVSMSVCAYDGGTLLWSGRVGQDAASRYGAALQQTSATYNPGGCQFRRGPRGNTSVELGLHGTGGATRWDIVDFDCQQILVRYGELGTDTLLAPLVPATVEPWASAGIKTYVPGPNGQADLAPYFRGMLG